jgi:hypothetical protein
MIATLLNCFDQVDLSGPPRQAIGTERNSSWQRCRLPFFKNISAIRSVSHAFASLALSSEKGGYYSELEVAVKVG